MKRLPLGLKIYSAFAVLGSVALIILDEMWRDALRAPGDIAQYGWRAFESAPLSGQYLLILPLLLASGIGVLLLKKWAYLIALALIGHGLLWDLLWFTPWYYHTDTLRPMPSWDLVLKGLILWYFLRPGVKAQFVKAATSNK